MSFVTQRSAHQLSVLPPITLDYRGKFWALPFSSLPSWYSWGPLPMLPDPIGSGVSPDCMIVADCLKQSRYFGSYTCVVNLFVSMCIH